MLGLLRTVQLVESWKEVGWLSQGSEFSANSSAPWLSVSKIP